MPTPAAHRADLIEIAAVGVRAIRRRLGLTQPDLARSLNVGVRTISAWEAGKSRAMRRETYEAFRAISAHPGYDFDREINPGAAAEWDNNVDLSTLRPIVEIPTFDRDLACGTWTEAIPVDDLLTPEQIAQGRFRVRLGGDSMERAWPDGSIVEFVAVRFGSSPSIDTCDGELRPGRDYYVQRSDGMATFKRLHACEDEGLVLRAINRRKYRKDLRVPWEEVARLSVAAGTFTPAPQPGPTP
jgi:transcriptional regulator with XRE-family HTH domain